MDCESRILRALIDNSKGLGVRELKRKTSEKCVRNWLPELLHRGYVNYNPKAERGKKKIVVITERGVNHRNLLHEIEKIEKKFLKEYGIPSADDTVLTVLFEKKLDLYEKLLMDIFSTCLETDYKIALRFLNMTLFAVRKVLDKKRWDIETKKIFLHAIQNAFLEKNP